MWTVPSPEASLHASVAHRPLRHPRRQRHHSALRAVAVTAALSLAGLLAACTPPTFPDPAPTKEEVPFLGQQMTHAQIGQWLAKVAAQRAQLQQTLQAQKMGCYQRFFVNTCLRQSRQSYQQQAAILRKQEIELRRQERVLVEIDKQLRLKERGQSAQ
ncbi:MAG: hypothetical protein Q4A28_01340 [Brachymonas sp.]|nr:hypothetical protein [Brachymonas sp.]